MPRKLENLPPNWDDIENECQHISLICPWTVTSGREIRTVVITCLNWTFNYDLWIGVTVPPEGKRNISKQIDINKHKPLLEYLSEALSDCKDSS